MQRSRGVLNISQILGLSGIELGRGAGSNLFLRIVVDLLIDGGVLGIGLDFCLQILESAAGDTGSIQSRTGNCGLLHGLVDSGSVNSRSTLGSVERGAYVARASLNRTGPRSEEHTSE